MSHLRTEGDSKLIAILRRETENNQQIIYDHIASSIFYLVKIHTSAEIPKSNAITIQLAAREGRLSIFSRFLKILSD